MKKNILLSISFAFLASLLLMPVKTYSQSRPEVKSNFIEQDTREMGKMKNALVKKRNLYVKLVLSKDKPPVIMEELSFNKKGLLIEKKRYNDAGFDYKIVYKYNSKDKLIQKNTFDSENNSVEKELTKVNKDGNPTEVYTETLTRGGIEKIRKIIKYGKNGLATESRIFDKDKKLVLIEKYEYNNDLMTSTKAYDSDENIIGSEDYEYDEQKRKVKEITTNFNPVVDKDSAATIRDKSEYSLKYDEKGNIIEVNATLYRQEFTFNENGDILRDVVYDKRGNRIQTDNAFEYDEKGLVEKITRFYPDGKPGAYLTYTYEYYDNTKPKK